MRVSNVADAINGSKQMVSSRQDRIVKNDSEVSLWKIKEVHRVSKLIYFYIEE
jgi:hypothetical protein